MFAGTGEPAGEPPSDHVRPPAAPAACTSRYDHRVADLGTALISGGMGLVGAVMGVVSAQWAARGTRESDRRKRCVDRVLAAMTQLDKAYADYVTGTQVEPENRHLVLHVQGALRGFNQATEMLDITSLRTAAGRYRDNLTEFYLMFGQPRDPLDDDRNVPTLQELNAEHLDLSQKLRNYETK